jgi:microcystin-dependent protein
MQSLPQINHSVETLREAFNLQSFYTLPHVGDFKFSARNTDYHGWLLCDGRNVNIDDYPTLYSIIGTNFGDPGEGEFNLPDLRGRVPAAEGQAGNVFRASGLAIGSETHTLTVNEMPSHTHTGTTSSNGAHNHGGVTGSSSPSSGAQGITALGGGNDVGEDNGSHAHTISTDGNHTHTFTTNSTGGGAAHSNMQPTLFIGHMFIFGGARNYQVDPIVLIE